MSDKHIRHTKEPWYFGEGAKLYSKATGERVPFHDTTPISYANAVRLVSCVNLMAGQDPARVKAILEIFPRLIAEAQQHSSFWTPRLNALLSEARALGGGE